MPKLIVFAGEGEESSVEHEAALSAMEAILDSPSTSYWLCTVPLLV